VSADGAEAIMRTQPTTRRPPLLVVGVGSELRSDDAVGRRVAESIGERRSSEQLEVRSVHQLTPELADAMTDRLLVIVVDACIGATAPVVTEVESIATAGAMTHHLDVAALVRLAEQLGRPPTHVMTLGVPAFDVGIGTSLSAQATAVVGAAVEVGLSLCDGTSSAATSSRSVGETTPG
jgi:hydrogenase maturation protease